MYIWIKLSTFDSRYKFESDTITNLIALVEHKNTGRGFFASVVGFPRLDCAGISLTLINLFESMEENLLNLLIHIIE